MAEEFYKDYDRLIRIACPVYNHCIDLMAGNIPNGVKNLLDLGSGTGNLIQSVLKKHPSLNVWGIELQPELISIANKKVSNQDVSFIEGDILKAKWPVADITTSSLTIHHFTHRQKRDVFKRIYNNSDYLLFFDLVKGETKTEEWRNKEYLYDHWKSEGLSEEWIKQGEKNMEVHDKPMTVKEHNKLFDDVGFKYDLLYNNHGFAVYFCNKKS